MLFVHIQAESELLAANVKTQTLLKFVATANCFELLDHQLTVNTAHGKYKLVVHLTILLATFYLHAVNAGNYLFGTVADKGAKKSY